MRVSYAITAASLFVLLFVTACNSGTPVASTETKGDGSQPQVDLFPTTGRDADQAAAMAKLPGKSATPGEIVAAFLNAARSGDDQTATLLLTSKARSETEREGLVLDPPGTPSMRFEIGKIEISPEDASAAYVNSVWSETETKSEQTFEVVWVLRKESQGWRIAGMAAETTAGTQPVFLNFEDPQDLLRIKSEVDGEPEPAVVNSTDTPHTARQPEKSATRR